MSEFLFELYSEEIPSNLQISAREEIKEKLEKSLLDQSIKAKEISAYSCPTRITIFIKDLPVQINIPSKEVRGPKVGVIDDILNNFIRAHKSTKKDLFKKNTEKGDFYFLKTLPSIVEVKDLVMKNLLNIISSIKWKKSMRWADTTLIWARPLRSIYATFNGKLLLFNYGHLRSTNNIIVERDLTKNIKKISSFKEYKNFLRKNNIIFDHNERENIILKKFKQICSKKNLSEKYNPVTLKEVINLVDNPNIFLVSFDKKYLEIPKEIIISTLESHQRYFPLFDQKDQLTNNFFVVSNKADKDNLIKDGNKKVVEARLSDAMFFWKKDKSKNLIKQISKLKKITFYEKLGTVYDKSIRIKQLAGYLSDDLNISKEKVEIAASIAKSDLCSELVGEFPELQGKMGKYFALAQGFDNDVANAVSDHYLPYGNDTAVPKKPISYTVSIVDKLDTLVGFFLINQKPSSSKDPFALRRSAIGLLKVIIENRLNFKLKDLINYNVALFKDQGINLINQNAEIEILKFLKERMRNILKEKNIKIDIIEAAISSHEGENFLELFKKSILMNKYINKDIGKNAISSYRRAHNIIGNSGDKILGKPDAVLFRKDEEKNLFDKINEIRKSLALKESEKNYENLLLSLSELKPFTDNFFDNVVVNDENRDIKNNRLELLQMFCNTFNNFLNFSKLEGVQ